MKNLKIDIQRYSQLTGSSFLKEPSSLVIILFRIAKAIQRINFLPLRIFLNLIVVPIYKLTSVIIGISIPRSCEIGPGLLIFHYGAIAINGLVKIGLNCTIRQGVTIGNRYSNDDVPIIGDNVDIGAGAVIIGKIFIGNNVKIGANAVVLQNVPNNHIAIGVPAKILPIKKR